LVSLERIPLHNWLEAGVILLTGVLVVFYSIQCLSQSVAKVVSIIFLVVSKAVLSNVVTYRTTILKVAVCESRVAVSSKSCLGMASKVVVDA